MQASTSETHQREKGEKGIKEESEWNGKWQKEMERRTYSWSRGTVVIQIRGFTCKHQKAYTLGSWYTTTLKDHIKNAAFIPQKASNVMTIPPKCTRFNKIKITGHFNSRQTERGLFIGWRPIGLAKTCIGTRAVFLGSWCFGAWFCQDSVKGYKTGEKHSHNPLFLYHSLTVLSLYYQSYILPFTVSMWARYWCAFLSWASLVLLIVLVNNLSSCVLHPVL